MITNGSKKEGRVGRVVARVSPARIYARNTRDADVRARAQEGLLLEPVQPVPVAILQQYSAQLLTYPMRWLRDLPEPTTMLVSLGGRPVVMSTSGEVCARCVEVQTPAFDGQELRVLARACEEGRCWAPDASVWAERKLRRPGWRLTVSEALGGVQAPGAPEGWTVGKVLRQLDIELLDVAVGMADGLEILDNLERENEP